MLTHGTKVCIGDHLDPTGMLDATSYRMIGDVFAEVEAKRPWCQDSANIADVALLSAVAVRAPGSINRADRHAPEDEGALRMLNEGHVLFDVIDPDADFAAYRVLVLPDRVKIAPALKAKLDAYLAQGGKLLLSAESGLAADGSGFALPVGADLLGPSPFNPTFIAPRADLQPDWITDPFAILAPSLRIKATEGDSLGAVFEPYFSRTPHHFNGHINAAALPDPSGYACGVRHGNVIYLAQPVFSLYRELGSVALKRYVLAALADLLGAPTMTVEGLPAAGTATLRRMPDGRRVAHLLYATPILKGQTVLGPLEVIEDLPAIGPVTITLPGATTARLEPQGVDLAVIDGRVTIDRFACHQMVVFS